VQGVYPNVSGGSAPIDFSLEYHIFAVEWSDAELHWFVDGKLVFSRFRGEPSSLFLPPVRVMMMLMMMLMLMKKMMVMMMVMLMMMLLTMMLMLMLMKKITVMVMVMMMLMIVLMLMPLLLLVMLTIILVIAKALHNVFYNQLCRCQCTSSSTQRWRIGSSRRRHGRRKCFSGSIGFAYTSETTSHVHFEARQAQGRRPQSLPLRQRGFACGI
jgi:hypothetical protein